MRAVSPELDSSKVRVGSRPGSRSERLRKSRLRNVALEWLEARQLLAALPTPLVTTQVNVSNSNGTSNDSAPSIAIDPTNPQHMVSVWTHFDTSQQGNPPNPQTYVEAAFSTNGGTTWNAMGKVSASIGDFTSTATPQPVFAQGSDASVGFDRSGNFYILSSQHTADSSSGELLLEKYNLSAGGALTQLVNNQRVYVWNGDGILKPTMAIDNNLASFTDGGGKTQTDPSTGNMYIAWESNDATPPNTGNWNPNTIRMIVSSDGGQTFSGITTLSNGGNFGTERMGAPRLTISQGSAGVPGGQVTVVWDDFGTFATASPTPLDGIDVNRITGTTQQFAGTQTAYGPAVTVNNVVVPAVTTIPIQVSPTSTFNISDLAVRLSISQADVNNISVTLTSPGGVTVPLIALAAITGANIGTVSPTLLDSNAPRAFAQGAAPYTGTFKPSGNLGVFNGLSSTNAGISGGWTITVTNNSTANGGSVNSAAVVLTGLTTSGQTTVAQVDVRGALGNSYGTASAANPFGIGPDPSLASDNTVGSFSQFQGRIYLTYVDRFDSNITQFAGNPADNTDIFMIASDNGGASWIVPSTGAAFATGGRGFNGELINNDNASTDGYSEAVTGTNGRAQFQPSVAVDPGTGAVVVSYYDGRYDAARARVAMTVAASIDGGTTFSQTYVNATLVVANQATGANVSNTASQLAVNPILPILDNESTGNTAANADRTVFGFGDHQGLAVINGKIFPVWSSNQNGGSNGKQLLNIFTAPTTYAVGPRIIGGSSGPIGISATGTTLDPNNTSTTADGTPIVSKFTVTFDRPVDPNSFGIASVVVHYEDVNGNVTNITPVSVVPQNSTAFGATNFLITFAPQSGVGTYSYEVLGNTITDRIPTAPPTAGVISGSKMDQNGNATAGQATDFFAMPTPTGNTAFTFPYSQDTLPLIIPGPHIVKSFSTAVGAVGGAADNEILNGTANSLDVTFDRNMDPSTVSAADVLRIQGPAGLVAGPFTMVPDPQAGENPAFPRTFKIGFPTQMLSGTYQITLASTIKSQTGFLLDTNLNAGVDVLKGTSTNAPIPLTVSANDTPVVIQPGQTVSSKITLGPNFLIQGITLQLNITYPNDPDLTATLIAPDGTRIVLFSALPPSGGTANFINTVLDDNAGTAISNANAPYTGRFRPSNSLTVLDGTSSITGPGGTGTGVYTLQITNAGTQSGSLGGWSMTLLQPNSSTGLGDPVSDRPQVSFRIFTMDPTNPLSHTTWTSVGPASVSGSNSGRVGGIEVDPSDPSGNTVYVAGASGGVWKTNNFLTTSSQGPTWIPLTDFGAALGVNTGGIAVFGHNNDPNQSIIFVATGEGDTGSAGVGFLRSMDGGATWTLLDSTDNTLPYASRDHRFVGTTAFDIMVDPNPTPSGNVVVYAALGGANGGLWRSTDSGMTWGVVNPANGQRIPNLAIKDAGGNTLPVTSLAFNSDSGTPSVNNPSGNLQVLYAGVEGSGVYISPNQGQVWSLMAGGVGDPLIHDSVTKNPIPVNQPAGNTPNGAFGRIVLVAPALMPSSVPNAALQNFIYQNWLYALVVTPDGNLQGLFVTKDQGQNWTQVRVATMPTTAGAGVNTRAAIPTNNINQADYNFLGGLGGFAAQGNYDVSIGIDPTNPNIVYLGGTLDGNASGFLRVDITGLNDPHALFQSDTLNDGGTLRVNSAGAISLQTPANGISANPEINLIRNPAAPLSGTATFTVGNNMGTFQNSGAGATWIPFDGATGFTDQHRLVTTIDPLTGHSRIITGDDQGIFSAVDNNGTIDTGIGNARLPSNSRNGNLQITQFYYGAVQPSSAAAQIAGALLYGSAQDDGTPNSNPNILTNGNIFWSGPTGDATGVATDQSGTSTTGLGTLYQYHWPCCGGNGTDFFQVNGVGRTNGLLQVSNPGPVPDPQWPNVAGFNFAVNPVNGNQIIMGSAAGRLFRTEDEGQNWLVIANPAILDSSTIPALAFGAPDPVTGGGSLDNFIYAGTAGGHMFVTFTGGGATGNSWFPISQGLDGSTIHAIVTDPNRGTYDAYAVTSNGVYYMSNALAAATNPNVIWQNITSNLFNLKNAPFGDPSLTQQWLLSLSSIQADWRYLIPDNASQPAGPSHPVLYVAGQGGVFYSLDKGKSWQPFPNQVSNSVPTALPFAANTNNGYFNGLPLATVSDLDMSIGTVDANTGHSVIAAGDPNALVATTYGSGVFAIRLAPFVMPNTNANGINPDYIFLDPSVNPTVSTIGQQITHLTPIIDGTSEQSAFGNTVTVKLFDLTAGTANPIPIPLAGTVTTDGNGHFKIVVAPGYFVTPGVYTVGVQSTDQTGASGNMAEFTFVFDPPPPAPTAIVLDSSTDSGTLGTDQYTSFNNSSSNTSPLLDVSGIVAPPTGGLTTVVLLRATVVGGVVGPFTIVNQQTYDPTSFSGAAGSLGTVQIADTNGGNGTIADNPVNTPPDTAPNQANQYVYQAFQIDFLHTSGNTFTSPLGVIVDTTDPTAPIAVSLDPASDSGTSNGDSYTNANNSNNNAPIFDVTGIEPHATVQLIRTDANGNQLIVGIVVNANPTGPNNTVQVKDVNANNTTIPDSPVGAPPDTAPPSGNPYTYTAIQIDLAGNPSGASTPTFGNKGAIVIDGTDADNHGSFTGGVNQDGWLYMQDVLNAIRPNITSTSKVLVALGPNPAINTGGGFGGAGSAVKSILNAFNQSSLPAQGWTLEYVVGATNMDNYLSGKPATAVSSTNTSLGTITLAQTGFIYITTFGHPADDMTAPELQVVDNHGLDILSYVNTGGGLYTQTETAAFTFGGGGGAVPPSYGWLSALFPTIQVVGVNSQNPRNIQLTPAGQATFPGLTSADLSGGPWHNYFSGTIPDSLTAMFTDTTPGQNNPANTVILGLSSVGTVSTGPATGDQVIIDATPPAQSTVSLDPSTNLGTLNNVQFTKFNNSSSNPPLFDVTGVEPNAIVKLFRVPGTFSGGTFSPTGNPVLVNTVTQPSNPAIAPGTIADTNAGNGAIPDGFYLYYITQTDLAGNVSVQSLGSPNFTTLNGTGVVIQIDATAPIAPQPFRLDPASDTGTFNNDNVTEDNNGNPFPAPVFDLFGIESNATVQLFRATIVNGVPTGAVLVNTLTNVTPTGPNGLVQVPDINGANGVIADGIYAYTAKQIDLAGNVGPSSNTVTVTINTAVPKPSPLPAPDLEAGSDTGVSNTDNITQANNGTFPAPIFDIGSQVQPVDRGATVQLYRAPVVNGNIGTPVLVDTLTNVAGGLIPIADNNGGNGQIANGTYNYYTKLISLSGVPGTGITVGGVTGLSTPLTVVINATLPLLATSLRLDATSDTGVSNSDGISRITLVNHPLFDVTGILVGATVNLYRAPVTNGVIGTAILVNTVNNVVPTGATNLVKINDPTVIPDGQYVYTVQEIDSAGNVGPIGVPTVAPAYPNNIIYDTAQPAIPTKPALDPASDTGAKGDNSTSNTSPFIDVAVSVPGFEQNAQLSLVRDGLVVATTPYNVTVSPVSIQDPGPVTLGTHTYQAFLTDLAGNISPLSPSVLLTFANDAPGTTTLDPGSDSGVKGDNITNITKPTFDVAGVAANGTLRLLRNGLVIATVPTGNGGTVMITDPGPLTSGVYTYASQVVDSKGNASPTGPPLIVTIDLVLPGSPTAFLLDPASDSGLKGDNLTNINNPTFDAKSAIPGATVNLFRNGTIVASLVSPVGGTITITDPGPVPDGTYTYLVQQVTVAGNVSPNSVQAIVTIQTATPATPPLVLDPASDSGNKGDNVTNVTSPSFDASSVVPGSTLKLYRNGLNVKTLTNVVLNASGLVVIQDPGPLTNGSYSYTAQQTTLAGNTSVIGSPLTITINTAAPVVPTTPVLILDTASDTGIKGDNITSTRKPTINGTADPAILVTLLDASGNTLGTTTSDALGNFSFSIAQSLTNGTYGYKAFATNGVGTKSPVSQTLTINVITVVGDFNGDAQTETAVFRRTQPFLAQWFAANTVGMATGLAFGAGSLDVPITGDFNGDGKTDPAVYRPSTATWYIAGSPSYATLTPVNFGQDNVDVPVPGNYNGSGITQIAVYRPTTGQWFVQGGVNPTPALVSPALSTDIPVPGNYDNTGKDEFAVYRPTTGTWYISSPGGVRTVTFDPGGAGGIPVPGAYDSSVSNHATEPSIFNATTGQWFINTASGTRTLNFNPGDIPVPGDYEGTGITEPVVYRPSTAQWFVESLTDTTPRLLASFGQVGRDIPALSPYRYRALGGGVNAGTNGTITAASISSLNLAASAVALSSSIAPATSATVNKAVTPTVAATTTSTARTRPAQVPQLVVEFGQGTGDLVDHALASLVKVRAPRKGGK
jgi:subtilisin-like proprotein convertase family protein